MKAGLTKIWNWCRITPKKVKEKPTSKSPKIDGYELVKVWADPYNDEYIYIPMNRGLNFKY